MRYQEGMIGKRLVALVFGLSVVNGAEAALSLLQPDPTIPATFIGNGGYSTDGATLINDLGLAVSGTLQAQVPAGATVVRAYLYGTYSLGFSGDTLEFAGAPVTLSNIANQLGFLATGRADVTSQVATQVGSGGAVYDFSVTTNPLGSGPESLALIVIYSQPDLPRQHISVLDGSATVTGDSATLNFATPLDKTVPGFTASLSLGIANSFNESCLVPGDQVTTVTVNGQLVSNCAGGFNDGTGFGLITVGGIGDNLDLPVADDDELYDIAPFLANGDRSLSLTTVNSSGDDNLFLAVVSVTATAALSTEICGDGLDNDGDGLIDQADPDCPPLPPVEVCSNGLDDDKDGLSDREDPDCAKEAKRMEGGGGIRDKSNSLRAEAEADLNCDIKGIGRPQKLEVEWGRNSKFQLRLVQAVTCSTKSNNQLRSGSSGRSSAGFDTHAGSGLGKYNGVSGAQIEWEIFDGAESGTKDTLALKIKDRSGNLILDAKGPLAKGNFKARR